MTDAALKDCLISPNESDRNGEVANVVDGLFAIARGLNRIAEELARLGLGETCSTPMGAAELLALEVKNGFDGLANAVHGIGER